MRRLLRARRIRSRSRRRCFFNTLRSTSSHWETVMGIDITRLRGSSVCEIIRAPFLRFRCRCGRPERDFGVVTSSSVPSRPLIADVPASASSSSSSSALGRRLFRTAGLGGSSSSPEGVLRFLSDREPSMGSSSRIRVLKTECESGLMPPLAAGNKSRAILGADERRREVRISGTCLKSSSRPFAMHSLHLQCDASD